MRGRIAMMALLLLATTATALAAAKPPQIGVTVLERNGDTLPVRLVCPEERETCKGTASFKGKKERRGKIYKLESAPFDFAQFKGGKKKVIRFRLSDSAKETLKRAKGMTVRVKIKAKYGAGRPGTVRVSTTLAP